MVDLWGRTKMVLILALVGFIPPFLFFGGPILLPIMYLLWRYVRWCLLLDLRTIYLIVRFPIWLVIELPLKYGLKKSVSFEKTFEIGLKWMMAHGKIYTIVYFLLLTGFAGLATGLTNMSLLTTDIGVHAALSGAQLVTLFAIPMFLTLLISSKMAQKNYENQKMLDNVQQNQGTPNYDRNAAASDKDREQKKKEEAIYAKIRDKKAKEANTSLMPQDMINVAQDLKNMFILGGKDKKYAKRAGKNAYKAGNELERYASAKSAKKAKSAATATKAASGAAMGSTVASGGGAIAGGGALASGGAIALLIIVAIMLLALFIMAVQWVILTSYFLFFLAPFMSSLAAAPLMGFLGFADDYVNYADQTIVDQYVPEIDIGMPAFTMEAGARIGCVLEGPHCLSEWRMNNTMQPGSDEVGEEYRLYLEDFTVNAGQQVDIAYEIDSELDIQFALRNPRYGLRGIPAENVQYSIIVTDPRDSDQIYCQTGYENVETITDPSTDIAPGDSAPVTSRDSDDLSFEECQLLQPGGAEMTRQVFIDYFYEYSSQSSLRVQAMSEENRRELELNKDFQKSETARTPVQSFINVFAPLTFNEQQGQTESLPFSAQIGFEVAQSDVIYRVDPESIEFRPSQQVERGSESQCDFEPKDDQENTYQLNEESIAQMETEIEAGEWYSSTSPLSTFDCEMRLQDGGQGISPSGETLIFDIDADYIVRHTEASEDLQVWNRHCSGRDCPMLLPEQTVEDDPELDPDNFITKCTSSRNDEESRADATGGCSVRSPNVDEWGSGLSENYPYNYGDIEDGHTAYRWDEEEIEEYSNEEQGELARELPNDKIAIGLEEEDWNRIVEQGGENIALTAIDDNRGQRTEIEEINPDRACTDAVSGDSLTNDPVDETLERFKEIWSFRNHGESGNVLYMNMDVGQCAPEDDRSWWDRNIAGSDNPEETFREELEECEERDGIMVDLDGSATCYVK